MDDDEATRNKWRDQLASIDTLPGAQIDALGGDELQRAIDILVSRQIKARETGGASEYEPACDIDTYDILFVDYDLLGLGNGPAITGEEVAYLARCYSRVEIIVTLNRGGDNTFDLTLCGRFGSYADYEIGSAQLANAGLWADTRRGFRPWAWPILPAAVAASRQRVRDLEGHLDDPVFDFLNLGGTPLPRGLRALLEVERAAEAVSFRKVVTESEAGLHRRDLSLNDEATRRIAAARVSKWLDTLVLPMQDILVDAPHLVTRFPSLLQGDGRSEDVWNATAHLLAGSARGLATQPTASAAYPLTDWLTRPAWFWHRLSANPDIDEVRDPWSRVDVDLLFCEDVSAFVPAAAAREFVASVEGPFSRRFVIDPEAAAAQPWRASVDGVSYRPPSNLAR